MTKRPTNLTENAHPNIAPVKLSLGTVSYSKNIFLLNKLDQFVNKNFFLLIRKMVQLIHEENFN